MSNSNPNPKYELISSDLPNMFRVKALKNFADVKVGDIGGYVAGPDNLSQEGTCWLYDNSKMYHNSRMYGNSEMHGTCSMYDNSKMHDNSSMWGSSEMYDNSEMHDNSGMWGGSRMYGNSEMHGDCKIQAKTQLHWAISTSMPTLNSSDGFTFAYDIKNNKVSAGCRYFTIHEALEHWKRTREGTAIGEERIAILRALLTIHNRPVNF